MTSQSCRFIRNCCSILKPAVEEFASPAKAVSAAAVSRGQAQAAEAPEHGRRETSLRGAHIMNNPRMLEGYRVLDFGQFVAGPTCGRLLAEMGAEVVKLELAPDGDRVREGGFKPMQPEYKSSSQSTYYFQHNHSKLSFAIDLKQSRARELVTAMLPKFDVLVENFAPGVIARLGFPYETVRQVNPRIIM